MVDLAYTALALALLGEDPAKTVVVDRTPENEGDENEAVGEEAWPEVFKDYEKDGSGGVYRRADAQEGIDPNNKVETIETGIPYQHRHH